MREADPNLSIVEILTGKPPVAGQLTSVLGLVRSSNHARNAILQSYRRFVYRLVRLVFPLELKCELHSFYHRMVEARRARLYQNGLPVWRSSQYDPVGSQRSDSRRFARSLDTQQICEMKKWASLTDLQLFLLGWDRGAEWGLSESNQGSCSEQGLSESKS